MYVLIDNVCGFIFGAVNASTPVEAAFLVDQECGNEIEEYREVYANEITATASIYNVYKLDNPNMLPCDIEDIDGQDSDLIEWVENLPLVARVARGFES